jgi:hypothetical protein
LTDINGPVECWLQISKLWQLRDEEALMAQEKLQSDAAAKGNEHVFSRAAGAS